MTTLRELSSEIMDVLDLARDPEIPEKAIADTLDGVSGAWNEKAVKVVHVIANNDSDIAAVDAEIKRLQDRKKVMVNGKDRLKEYLRFNMESTGITKIESDLFTITLAAGRDIAVIDSADDLPDDYVNVKTTIAPAKADILKALKEGVDVPGAHIEKSRSSVRIK